MPIKIRRIDVRREEESGAVIVVSGPVEEGEPAFRVGPAKDEAEIIAVPQR